MSSDNQQFLPNYDYTEIFKLNKMLQDANIPHTFNRAYDGWQICYPCRYNRIVSVIEHNSSYGSKVNLLEMMGLVPDEIEDDVEGFLTAEKVFNRIKEHFDVNYSKILNHIL